MTSTLGRLRQRTPRAVVSLVLAIALALLAFPEVVVLGGSLSSTGMNELLSPTAEPDTVSAYPDVEGREPDSGMRDVGSRVWQLEAATKHMANVIDEGDTPYWNPYSAAGSLGPETLADVKLSPFVVSVALLGGSSTAFTVVLLLFLVGALYCLQQFFTRTLGLHRVAAIGACIVFLLNGWATGMLTSAMSAPYVLFPVVLYASCELLRRATPLRYVAAVAAFVALFATTFAPSVVLVLLAVACISLVLDLGWPLRGSVAAAPRAVRALVRVGRLAAAPVTALLVSAYVWLPLVDALRHAGDDVAEYGERVLPTKDAILWLTVLTPRHAFRSFDTDAYPGVMSGDWTVYLGLAPLILIAAAFPRAVGASRRLLVVATGLMGLGLVCHLGVPGLKSIALIPLFRPIGAAYWSSLAAAGLVVAFGVAVDVAARRGLSARVAAGAGAVFAVVLLIGTVGFDDHPTTQVVSVVLALVMIGAAIALVAFVPRRSSTRWLAFGAVALVTVELLSYQNHQRIERYDVEDHLPAYLDVIRDDLGNDRILNAGRGGLYPEWGSALGIREITTINLMQQPWYREYFQRWVDPTGPPRKFLELGRRDGPFSSAPNALDALSVRYLVVDAGLERMDREIAAMYPLVFDDEDAGVRVYENTDAYPRAYLAPSLIPYYDGKLGPLWTRDIAVSDDAQLLDEAAQAGVAATLTPADDGLTTADDDAAIVDESNGRVEIELDAAQPSVLVLTDTFHRNWRVEVNGAEQHIGRVNHFARGVVVPAGPSSVVFTYSSPARSLGAIISLVSLAALVVGCAAWAILRRRRTDDPPAGEDDRHGHDAGGEEPTVDDRAEPVGVGG